MVGKKSQLRIKQMSFMLLAAVLFFVLAGMFFLMFSYSNLKNKATDLNKQQALKIALRLAGSSEFGCVDQAYCIDTDKVIALKGRSAYLDFWDVSAIEVIKLENRSRECTLASYPDCELIKVIDNNDTNKIAVPLYVSLCRKALEYGNVYDKCELGQLLVYYKRI